MKLSTRGRYATRALLDIALHYKNGPVQLKDISLREGISPKYLDQILTQLKHAGVITASRGPNGGFELSKDPSEITLLEVVSAAEGSLTILDCVGEQRVCPRSSVCVARDVWIEVSKAIENVLSRVTLAQLLEKAKKIQMDQ